MDGRAAADQPTSRYAGEICGAEAVLLFSCTLVLATLLPAIERAFGGLDRVAVWHRRAATAGVLLLLPHVVLATSSPDRYATGFGPGVGQVALVGLVVLSVWALAPRLRAVRWPGPVRWLARASYERWLTAHRLTGLFVVAAVAHGALVDPALRDSTMLRVVYLTIGGVGIAAYGYRELFARFVVPVYDYTVTDVRRPNDATLEISLEPGRDPGRDRRRPREEADRRPEGSSRCRAADPGRVSGFTRTSPRRSPRSVPAARRSAGPVRVGTRRTRAVSPVGCPSPRNGQRARR